VRTRKILTEPARGEDAVVVGSDFDLLAPSRRLCVDQWIRKRNEAGRVWDEFRLQDIEKHCHCDLIDETVSGLARRRRVHWIERPESSRQSFHVRWCS
jgi:hypothetical protein